MQTQKLTRHLFFRIAGLLIVMFSASFIQRSGAQAVSDTSQRLSPEILPGKGIKQFDFFYAGEGKSRNMYIVQNGKITWSYTDTTGRGEISDVILMKNGNIIFAHQFGVTLIDHNKKVLSNYNTPD